MRGEGLETLYKSLGCYEGLLGDGVPEIVILRGIGVAQRDVADESERDEGYLIDVAHLGDGARLHVDGLGLGEMTDDLAHLVLGIDEPVTGNDQSRLGT